MPVTEFHGLFQVLRRGNRRGGVIGIIQIEDLGSRHVLWRKVPEDNEEIIFLLQGDQDRIPARQ